MNNKVNFFLISLSGIIAIGAVGLYIFSLTLTTNQYDEGASVVGKIQQLDTSWSMETVKVRANPQSDFDTLASFIPKLSGLKNKLNEIVITDSNLPNRFASSISGYIQQLEAKEEKIERFKSGFAIIRNSERYLPLAARSVSLAAQSVNLPEIGIAVSTLADDINTYVSSPNDADHKRIIAELQNLGNSSASYPPKLGSELAGFLSHGEVLMENAQSTERLLADATSDKPGEKAENLIAGFKTLSSDIRNRRDQYQFAAIGALVLTALLGFFVSIRKTSGTPGSKNTNSGNQETTYSTSSVSSLDSSEISYKIFAGLIVKDIVQSLGNINSSIDQVKHNANGVGMAFARVNNTVGNVDRGILPRDQALAEIKSDLSSSSVQDTSSLSLRNAVDKLAVDYQTALRAVKQISDFAGAENEAEFEWVNINDVVREIVYPANYNNHAQIDIRLGDIPHLYASPSEIRYMFGNIVNNALTAIQLADKTDGCLKVQTQVIDNQISITITDNGIGMSSEKRKTLHQIFKPEKLGKLDLGFPAASYIVRKYGGRILMNSIPEKGTAVRVVLPEGQQAAA